MKTPNHTRSKYEIIDVNNIEVSVDVSMLRKSESLYFNATQISKQFDKDPRDFISRSAETAEYIQCLISDSNSGLTTELDCVKTRRGKYGGTWLHNKLALRFARWCSVPFEYQLDRWIEQRIDDEHQRKLDRDAARTGYLPMTNAIQDAHDPAMNYHYMNEADLLNRIVLGSSAKQFKLNHGVDSVRDGCDSYQIHMLDKLQRINISLIELGIAYDERREQLQRFIDKESALPANDCISLEVAA